MTDVAGEAKRRRTFAVISHPDAGKSTMTEALALHASAITQAGAVHGKAGRRGVTSDWMELERTRGISITSAALQFELPRPRGQPARHARPRRLLRGHLPGAGRRRLRGHAARRGQGHRAADPEAVRGLPAPPHPGHHVRQQVGPARPRAAANCSTRSRSGSACARPRSPGRSASPATSAAWSTGPSGEFDPLHAHPGRCDQGAGGRPRPPSRRRPSGAATGCGPARRSALLDEIGADHDQKAFGRTSRPPCCSARR